MYDKRYQLLNRDNIFGKGIFKNYRGDFVKKKLNSKKNVYER